MALQCVTFWLELLKKVRIADDIKNNEDDVQLELEKLLKLKLPYHSIGIYPFGSRIMGVAQETSDLDVYVELDNSFYEYSESPTMEVLERQRIVANAFNSESNWKRIATFGGRCPIVVVKHSTGLQCDLSFFNGLTYRQNILVMYLFELQPIARYMVIYLRDWIQNIGLKDVFRSHILILMVIFFLQLHNHLPGIDRLQANQEPTVGPWVTTFNQLKLSDFNMSKLEVNEYNTRSVLKQFFRFYANFNFAQYAICPYLGRYVERLLFDRHMPQRYTQLRSRDNKFTRFTTAIQDFILLDFNKGWQIKGMHVRTFIYRCQKELD
ncbi:terminal uridylyltransferase Tailor isoform X2 [Drosophila virilis]|uniref:Uncharacterized protein, isoform A n=1 Tax=Drosophila virilis TaxID=7244 RepID=B4M577_DROVI|nr:terminal uridylyltransferase Tailor isoform X2 [Drosophila virilis]EDW59788.2 uncharacterized protein Dvir_GJ10088, isoform A [Drosophila virilis]